MERWFCLLVIAFLISGCVTSTPEADQVPGVSQKAPETPQEEVGLPEEEPAHEVVSQPDLVNGKPLGQRLQDAYDNLHEAGSSEQIVEDFPDVELVFTDNGESALFPEEILPFHYYYSKEADRTFNLCGVGRSVFICEGKLDRLITKEDVDSGRCEVTPIYLGDPRLGGSGEMDFASAYG